MSRRELENFATPSPATLKLLEQAMQQMQLSARAYDPDSQGGTHDCWSRWSGDN